MLAGISLEADASCCTALGSRSCEPAESCEINDLAVGLGRSFFPGIFSPKSERASMSIEVRE
jgi:hypothetical protein